MAGRGLYVATETFLTNVDGAPQTIIRGQTLVSGDSDLYKRFPQYFQEAEAQHRGVEQATAAPGETRDIEIAEEPEEEPPAEGKAKK